VALGCLNLVPASRTQVHLVGYLALDRIVRFVILRAFHDQFDFIRREGLLLVVGYVYGGYVEPPLQFLYLERSL